MSGGPEIEIASTDHLDLLTGLAAGFRDHLGRSKPTNVQLAESIGALLADDGTEFLVAIDENGRGVGFAQLRYRYSMWLSATEACLEDLFVAPASRGRGLGTRIVERALERAMEKGCASVVVDTNERNLPAVKLYTGLGFSSSSTRWNMGRQLWFRRRLS